MIAWFRLLNFDYSISMTQFGWLNFNDSISMTQLRQLDFDNSISITRFENLIFDDTILITQFGFWYLNIDLHFNFVCNLQASYHRSSTFCITSRKRTWNSHFEIWQWWNLEGTYTGSYRGCCTRSFARKFWSRRYFICILHFVFKSLNFDVFFFAQN